LNGSGWFLSVRLAIKRVYRGVLHRSLKPISRAAFELLRALQLAARPFILLKIDTFYSGRIGHLLSEYEEVINQSAAKSDEARFRNIIFFPRNPCNRYLNGRVMEQFRQLPSTIIVDVGRNPFLRFLALGGSQLRARYFQGKVAEPYYAGPRTNGGLFMSNKHISNLPILTLPESEMDDGWALLEDLGLQRSRPLICIHVRDNAYLPGLAYNDYRDPPLRGYEDLARYLLNEGFNVVRTGSAANQPMAINSSAFLDYPFSDIKSDLMDLFMYAACELAVAGCISGIDYIPVVFRKPLVICDLRPLLLPSYAADKSLVIFSLMRWTETESVLSLAEMSRNIRFLTEEYFELGIEFVPNTSEEIVGAVKEQISRVMENTEPDQIALSRQEKTLKIYLSQFSVPGARVAQMPGPESLPIFGRDFLERHWIELGLSK
jgi:putative glycosyltransferase (TIGR04372 family)